MNNILVSSHSGRGLPDKATDPAIDPKPRTPQDRLVFTAAHRNAGQPVRRITSAELFGNNQEIEIEHSGGRYRLRQTASGKLIMTK
jgi:hemin uptake protein HemP